MFQKLINRASFKDELSGFFLLIFLVSFSFSGNSQILFSEDCFIGGVTVAGMDQGGGASFGTISKIHWNSDFTLRRAVAVNYRYGRPVPYKMRINGSNILWDMTTQAGPEQIETNPLTNFFAPNAKDITDIIQINGDSLIIDFPSQPNNPNETNWGWWGCYVIIEYQATNITNPICVRIYTADQSQVTGQNYQFNTPPFNETSPIVFSIFSSRLSSFYSDRSHIGINSETLGEIWGPDSVSPVAASGVQGHFFYEDGQVVGLNGDVANNSVDQQDGLARINDFVNTQESFQTLVLYRVEYEMYGGFNPHPAFLITYTPSCPVSSANIPRAYSNCYYPSNPRGQPDKIDSLQFQALPGYDHYNWTPGTAFNDSTLANPSLAADSSGWYRVRMWSDDPDGLCAQTIPVFLTVGEVPRPAKLEISPTSCPNASGRIAFKKMAGAPPFHYSVNGISQSDPVFAGLEAGTYHLSVTDSLGCAWDSTVVVQVNPVQQAAFDANPESGYSPLRVVFTNTSTNSTTFQWLIDGEPFSTNKNTFYTFPDSGSFEVALVAYSDDKGCSDTAYATITVFPGIDVILPNIITPNGDGRNDNLVAQVSGVKSMQWQVYNRWGKRITSGEVSDPETSVVLWVPGQGQFAAGVYTVAMRVTGYSGEVRQIAGQVQVVE